MPTPDLLNQIVAQLQDTIPLLKSQISFSKDFADKNKLQQLLNDLVAQKEALKNEEKDKTDQELALSAANTLLETTEKLYEAEKTIANFDQHRQKLHLTNLALCAVQHIIRWQTTMCRNCQKPNSNATNNATRLII